VRASALDCLRRGLLSLRANWELVVAQWLGAFVLMALMIGGLVPLVFGLGLSFADFFPPGGSEPGDVAGTVLEALSAGVGPLLLGVGGLLVTWTLAALVYCWLIAGMYGVLHAADRQAPASEPGGAVPGGWAMFRTFSWGDFSGWGRRYWGRYFGFVNLYGLLLLIVVALFAALVFAAVGAGQQWGAPAGIGLGCGGALPLGFLIVVTALWSTLAFADLPAAGVGSASRMALAVLGRRLGAVLLLLLLAICASIAINSLFLPLSMIGSAAADSPLSSILWQGPSTILQWIFATVVNVAHAASLVALMRSERGDLAAAAGA
jgi:hypothetical protein